MTFIITFNSCPLLYDNSQQHSLSYVSKFFYFFFCNQSQIGLRRNKNQMQLDRLMWSNSVCVTFRTKKYCYPRNSPKWVGLFNNCVPLRKSKCFFLYIALLFNHTSHTVIFSGNSVKRDHVFKIVKKECWGLWAIQPNFLPAITF